jgi:hypothetical protein
LFDGQRNCRLEAGNVHADFRGTAFV